MKPASSSAGARRALAIAATVVVVLAGLWPRQGQDPRYHDFADVRSLLGCANAADVLSNLAFLIVAVFAVRSYQRGEIVRGRATVVFIVGTALTGLGSAWYHWAPSDDRLVWDRLGMVVAFAGIVGIVIDDRIGGAIGKRIVPWLLGAGIASVVYWRWSETRGMGDLRPYAAMQALPMALVLVALVFGRGRRAAPLAASFAFYAAAKLAELGDRAVYSAVGFVSGHTLKHLLAAASCAAVVRFVKESK